QELNLVSHLQKNKTMEKHINNSKFSPLTKGELEKTQGGWLIFVGGVFVAATAYGYVKEKLDSGQW
ncbi:MAG: hypothetical protein O9252_03405, partial [Algoriphagus sp.]|nr:hypothetical protein [Algoriphagus sp.]